MAQQPNNTGGLGWAVAGVLALILVGTNAGSNSGTSSINSTYVPAAPYVPEPVSYGPPLGAEAPARASAPIADAEDEVAVAPVEAGAIDIAAAPPEYPAPVEDEDRDPSDVASGSGFASTVRPAAAPGSSTAYPYSSSVSAPTYAADTSIPSTGCAENGSCYGDISSATGRPRTVHVRGYTRRDGTYVRSHYRSRPGR